MHVRYRQFRTLRVSVTSFYVIRRDAYTVSGGSGNPPCSRRAHWLDTWLLTLGCWKMQSFTEVLRNEFHFHTSQILYELEKKSSLVTRALSAKSCTRDTDSLHSCTQIRLVQEMACPYHSCKILPRKHSYPNLIPVIIFVVICSLSLPNAVFNYKFVLSYYLSRSCSQMLTNIIYRYVYQPIQIIDISDRTHPYEKVPWYSHGATMVYHGNQWYTMVRCNCTMVQITCTMVDYGIPWYILTVPWHILVQPWFTELVPWCIMIYHGTSLHNHSTIYL